MGITIDKAILRIEHSWMSDDDKETADFIINTMRKYQMMQADYENRLKADIVAMLTDIQLEIEENSYSENVYGDEYGIDQVISTDEIYQFIQQKIDALKAESEE